MNHAVCHPSPPLVPPMINQVIIYSDDSMNRDVIGP